MKQIYEMALDLVENYTFEKYKKLVEACEENNVFFAEERHDDTLEFWIEDDHFICE